MFAPRFSPLYLTPPLWCLPHISYTKKMDKMIRETNPGLASRFSERLEFPPWTEADCAAAIAAKARAKGVELGPEELSVLASGLAVLKTAKGWANARDAHSCYDLLYKARAKRMGRTAR